MNPWNEDPEELSNEMLAVLCRHVFGLRDRGFDLADTADELHTDQDSIIAVLEEATERGLVAP